MAGLNDRRMLGTESGRIRRAARMVERNGGNPNELLNRAANAKLGEGSAISSSEDNIAFNEAKRRTAAGLNESRRRVTLGGGSAQTGTVPQPSTNASLNAARPGETPSQVQARQLASRQGITPQPTGITPQPTGTAQPSAPGTLANSLTGILGMRNTLNDEASLSRRKEMRAATDTLTGTADAPGNLTDIQGRETKDRADAIAAARSESSGNASVTRYSVIDRLNKERVAGGRQPFGEDIYKDIAKIDGDEAAGKQAVKTATAMANRTEIGNAFNTPLQKSLAAAKTRFAPDGPLVDLQESSEDASARKRKEQPMMVGGKPVPQLGEAKTPKFNLYPKKENLLTSRFTR